VKSSVFTLANALTLSRLPLGILLVFAFSTPWRYAILAAAVVTDVFDGRLARRAKTASNVGAMLDAGVDKAFTALAFFPAYFTWDTPVFLVPLFFMRDIISACCGLALYKRRPHVKARWSGKLVTTLQFIVIIFLMIGPLSYALHWGTLLLAGTILWMLDHLLHFHRSRRVVGHHSSRH